MSGRHRIVVATNAFGMGVDKEDVRTIIHWEMPGTVEAYYQEIGRAGRDGKPSRAVLLFREGDRRTQEFFVRSSHPARRARPPHLGAAAGRGQPHGVHGRGDAGRRAAGRQRRARGEQLPDRAPPRGLPAPHLCERADRARLPDRAGGSRGGAGRARGGVRRCARRDGSGGAAPAAAGGQRAGDPPAPGPAGPGPVPGAGSGHRRAARPGGPASDPLGAGGAGGRRGAAAHGGAPPARRGGDEAPPRAGVRQDHEDDRLRPRPLPAPVPARVLRADAAV